MDGRVISIFAAVFITLGGTVAALVVLDPMQTPSDYSLFAKVAEGEFEEDLFYSYTRDSDNYTHYKSITVNNVSDFTITVYRTEHQQMTDVPLDFDLEEFIETLFDFRYEPAVPEGITVSSVTDGTLVTWTVTGTGSINTGSVLTGQKEMSCTFTDFEIIIDSDTEEVSGITGEVYFFGSRNTVTPNQYYSYNDVTYKFTELLGVPTFTVSGEIDSEGTWIYMDSSKLTSEFEKFYTYSIEQVQSEEYTYAGVECTKYTLNGADSNTHEVYKDVTAFVSEDRFMIELYGTIDNEPVKIKSEIYYQTY